MHCVRRNSAKPRCTAPGEVPSPILSMNRLIGFQNTNRGFTKKTQERKCEEAVLAVARRQEKYTVAQPCFPKPHT